MKRWILLLTLFPRLATAQPVAHLTLSQAYDLALKNYPYIKQRDLVKQTEDITIENLRKGYLPQVTMNGQATYQSEVTGITFPVAGFTIQPLTKDQYKVVVADVDQLVYDGGIIRQQKAATQLNAEVEEQRVEVELYQLKDRINRVFLGILFLDEQVKETDLVIHDIDVGIKQVDAQVKNGVKLKSELNVLKAQRLQIDQHVIELKATRKGLIETLGLFLNQPLDENTVFEKPAMEVSLAAEIARPELKLYDDQSNLIMHQNKLVTAKNLPKAGLFAQGGYGKPALNFLENKFSWYYLVGVRFNWPLGGLYTLKKEKELNEVSKRMVDVERETFLLNTNTQLKQQQWEIDKFNQLINTDVGIIDLREQVKVAASAQLENGVITANDYLREVNAENEARQALITHRLQLLQAQINYQTTLGKQ
jgi:outer membrane protein TolC